MATNNAINANGTGIVKYDGSGTYSATTVTIHNLLVGATSNAITSVAPSATSGIPVISQGASADPVFGTATVPGGGTAKTSFTAYAIICGGTTTTSALQSVASVGTSGQVLTSNGASALPTFQDAAASGITTIAGSTGTTTGPTVTIVGQDGFTTSVSGTTLTATPRGVGTHNMFLGQGAGNLTVGFGENVGYGALSMPNLASASNNCAFGSQTLQLLDNYSNATAMGYTAGQNQLGNGNCAFGASSLAGAGAPGGINSNNNSAFGNSSLMSGNSGGSNCAFGLSTLHVCTSGGSNLAAGPGALDNLVSGSLNCALGNEAGTNYTTSESSNIVIMNSGVIADNNTIRIGTQGSSPGQQNQCFIAGITGISITSGQAVVIDSNGKLGTSSSGTGSWIDETSATATLAVGVGYVTDRGGGVTYTLPSTASLGDTITILGKTGAWSIAQNANQSIKVGVATSTVGVGGSVASTDASNCITLKCVTSGASTVWTAFPVSGSLTVV